MSRVTIESIEQPDPVPEPLAAFELERPAAGGEWEGPTLEISGRLISVGREPAGVEIFAGCRLLRRLAVERRRCDEPGWRQRAARGEGWGFLGAVTTLGLPARVRLDVAVRWSDGDREIVATVAARREPIATGYEAGLQPVLVTSLGRMGAVRVMSLLAVHPQVVTPGRVPYDGRVAGHWLRTLVSLAEPELGPGGDAGPDLVREPRPGAGLFVERAARLCQRNIDDWYQQLARDQVKPGARWFAERAAPGDAQAVLRELYPASRELFVVRDLRDWVASVLAADTGGDEPAPGELRRGAGEPVAAFVRRVGERARRLRAEWDERREGAHLVRFEDLASDPAAALLGLLGALDLDAHPAGVRGLLEEARGELRSHPRAAASARLDAPGRWRYDLPPEARGIVSEELREVQVAFGYARGGAVGGPEVQLASSSGGLRALAEGRER